MSVVGNPVDSSGPLSTAGTAEELREALQSLERLHQQESKARQTSQNLLAGLQILNNTQSVAELYADMLSLLGDMIPVTASAILVPDDTGDRLVPVARTSSQLCLSADSKEGIFARALAGRSVIASDLNAIEAWQRAEASSTSVYRSALIVRLCSGEESALIVCLHGERAAFGKHHLESLETFAPLGAQAVQQARRFEEVQQHRDQLEKEVAERTAQLREQARQLEGALNKERELSGLQRQFVAMVCHEFRTPMAIIDGTAQRLLRRFSTIKPERATEALGKIRQTVVRVIELMESVLAAARLEEGKIVCSPEPCHLSALLDDVTGNFRELNPDRPITTDLVALPAQVDVDPNLIRQVFSNLISNAIKYSPGGKSVAIHGWLARSGEVMVSIADQGAGIPKDELSRLFERFFRASTSTGIPGTGIGLHLVKHLLDLHGGRISVESEVNVGTTFTVILPSNLNR